MEKIKELWNRAIAKAGVSRFMLYVMGFMLLVGLMWLSGMSKQAEPDPDREIVDNESGFNMEYIYVSHASWKDHAFLINVDPEDVFELKITATQPERATQAWMFDGINIFFFENTGTLSIYAPYGIKITKSMSGAFSGMPNLIGISGLNQLETSSVTDMSRLFQGDKLLKYVPIQDLNTSRVTTIDNMFEDCDALTELDFSKSDFDNVVSMNNFMKGCGSIERLVVPKLNDIKAMKFAFSEVGMRALHPTIIEGELNTSECVDFTGMFSYTRINNLNEWVANLDVSKAEKVDEMFFESSLYEIDLSNWNTETIRTAKNMFAGCTYLFSCKLDWNIPNMKDMSYFFSRCNGLENIDFKLKNPDKLKNMDRAFNECYCLEHLDLSSLDGISLESSRHMFAFDGELLDIKSNGFNSKDVHHMFLYCRELDPETKLFQLDPSFLPMDQRVKKEEPEETVSEEISNEELNS